MEKITDNLVEDKLIEYNGLVVTTSDIETCIDNYTMTLYDSNDLYVKGHKSFNGLLLYIYNHCLKYIIPNTWNNDYMLLDDIFNYIFIPLCYRYNRIPCIQLFTILCHIDYSMFYDIRTGVYKNVNNSSMVNHNISTIVKKWINICNGELLENIMHTGNIGAMFIAKVHGFREDNATNISITVNAPQISETQLQKLASGVIPELPNSDE